MNLTYMSLEKKDRVAVAWFNKPKMNTYDTDLMRDISTIIDEVRFDDSIDICVFASKLDGIWSSGADINLLATSTPEYKAMFCLNCQEVLNKMETTPKLFIAAIGGDCVGGRPQRGKVRLGQRPLDRVGPRGILGQRPAGEDLGEQVLAGREPQDQGSGVVHQPSGDGDQPSAEGGDHGLAAADAVAVQDHLAAGGGGELMQPGGHAGGEQRAPHPGRVHLEVSAGQVPKRGAELAATND